MAEFQQGDFLVHRLRKDVTFETTSGEPIKMGRLPAGAVVLRTVIGVTEAFDAGTTNVLIVGTATDDDALVAAGGVDETAVAVTSVAPATLAGAVAPSADTDIYVEFTQSGTAATAGAAWVVVEYALDPEAYV